MNYRLFGTKRKANECKMSQGYLWYSFIDLHQISACPHKSSENCCLFEVTKALKGNLYKNLNLLYGLTLNYLEFLLEIVIF